MNRLVLSVYPKTYRDTHGDELLTCLAEAHPGTVLLGLAATLPAVILATRRNTQLR